MTTIIPQSELDDLQTALADLRRTRAPSGSFCANSRRTVPLATPLTPAAVSWPTRPDLSIADVRQRLSGSRHVAVRGSCGRGLTLRHRLADINRRLILPK